MARPGQRIAAAFAPAAMGMDPIRAMDTLSDIEYRRFLMSGGNRDPIGTARTQQMIEQSGASFPLEQEQRGETLKGSKIANEVAEATKGDRIDDQHLTTMQKREDFLNWTPRFNQSRLSQEAAATGASNATRDATASTMRRQEALHPGELLQQGATLESTNAATEASRAATEEKNRQAARENNAGASRLALAAMQSGLPQRIFSKYLESQQEYGDDMGGMPIPTSDVPEGRPSRLQAAMENYLTLTGSDQKLSPTDITSVAENVSLRPVKVQKAEAEAVQEGNKAIVSRFDAALYNDQDPAHQRALDQYTKMHHPDRQPEATKELDEVKAMVKAAGMPDDEGAKFVGDWVKAKLDALKRKGVAGERAPNQVEVLELAIQNAKMPPEQADILRRQFADRYASGGGSNSKPAQTHGIYLNPKTNKEELAFVDENGRTTWTGVRPPPDVAKAPDLYDIKTEQRGDGRYYLIYMPKEPSSKLKPITTDIQAPAMMDPTALLISNALRPGGSAPAPRPAPSPTPSGGTARPGSPRIGEVIDGYRYKGGNPADKSSWQKQ